MKGGLIARLTVCIVAILLSIWVLLPTFLGKEVQDTLELAAERAKMEDPPALAEPLPWWVSWLPNRKVELGLDLKGGIDLTLQVEVKEAVLSSVQRDVSSVKAAAEAEKVTLTDVKRERREPRLMIQMGEGTTLEMVQGMMRSRLPAYSYTTSQSDDKGKSWLVFELSDAARQTIEKHAVEQARQTIENRINETGVKEPQITIKGDDGINIQLPGETNVDDAVRTVGTTARLEFYLVDEDADLEAISRAVQDARAAMPPESFAKDKELSEWLQDNGKLAENRILRWEYFKQDGVETRVRNYVLKDTIELTGDDVNDAQSQQDAQNGEWHVQLQFKAAGQEDFARITGENVGKRFAIVLDDQVKSAPVIMTRINGTASISMGAGGMEEQLKDASQLALWLRSGALPAPVSVGEVRTVGATLGEQAIQEGIIAALVGTSLVFLFAAVYYRVSGLLADVTLSVNVLLVVALLATVGATLTLPGICGIALTVGMAVDCNIIIYERIREEIGEGRGVRAAVDAGFERAFVAVFDSNITTLIAGIVLYSYGTGPLKGFAVTLMIGIFTTLFTGVFVARALMELSIAGSRSTRLSI